MLTKGMILEDSVQRTGLLNREYANKPTPSNYREHHNKNRYEEKDNFRDRSYKHYQKKPEEVRSFEFRKHQQKPR